MEKPKFMQTKESAKIPSRSSVQMLKLSKQETAIKRRPITPGPTRALVICKRERSKVHGKDQKTSKIVKVNNLNSKTQHERM